MNRKHLTGAISILAAIMLVVCSCTPGGKGGSESAESTEASEISEKVTSSEASDSVSETTSETEKQGDETEKAQETTEKHTEQTEGKESNTEPAETKKKDDADTGMEKYLITDSEFGAVPGDEKDDTAAINAAISKAGGRNVLVVIPSGEYSVKSNFTVPENITLVFDKGGYLCVDKDITVTLNGRIDSVNQQIFTGDGKFNGTSHSECYLRWFGVSANGQPASKRMQEAVNIFDTVLLTPGTSAWVFGEINITKPVTVEGIGAVRVEVRHSAKQNMFNIASSNVTFKNLNFIGADGCKDTAVFYFDTSKCSMKKIVIDNCFGTSNGYCLKDANTGKNTVSDFSMTSCNFSINYNEGIYLTDFSNGIAFSDVVINNVPGPATVTYPCWYIANVTGMVMDNIDAAGGLANGENADGFVFENCSNVEILRGMQDYVNGVGLKVINSTKLHFSNLVCSLYEGYGIYMEGVTDSVFDLIKANGIYPTVDVKATRGVVYDSVKLVKCSSVTFNNLSMEYNQSNGLTVEDSDHIVINSLVYTASNGIPYRESGTSDYNTVNGAIVSGNYSGKNCDMIQIGEHSKIRGASFQFGNPVSAEGPATLK